MKNAISDIFEVLSHSLPTFLDTNFSPFSPYVLVSLIKDNDHLSLQSYGQFVYEGSLITPNTRYHSLQSAQDLTAKLTLSVPQQWERSRDGYGGIYFTPEGDKVIIAIGGLPFEAARRLLILLESKLYPAGIVLSPQDMAI